MKDYHINIFYSQEDGGYIADIPDLPHCAAFGEGPEEALAEVLKAKAAWMEAAKAEGANQSHHPLSSPSFINCPRPAANCNVAQPLSPRRAADPNGGLAVHRTG